MECSVGDNLNSSNTCDVITYMEGCMSIDPVTVGLASNSMKCLLCYRGYKLDPTSLTCTIAPSISDCIQYEINSGNCQVCSISKQPDATNENCINITTVTLSLIHI